MLLTSGVVILCKRMKCWHQVEQSLEIWLCRSRLQCATLVIGKTNGLGDTEKDFYDRITLEKTNIQAPELEKVPVSSYKTFCIPVITARGTPICAIHTAEPVVRSN